MSNSENYLMAVDWVLKNADASTRSWRTAGRRIRLPSGVPYRFVSRPVIGPQAATVSLQVRDEDLKTVLALDERFAMVAGASFVRVYRELSLVRIEFTLPFSQWSEVYLSDMPHRPDVVTFGRTALGSIARLGWDSPHKAIFGTSQSGKTTCLTDFILSMARANRPDEQQMIILNPKNDQKLIPFGRLAHLAAPIATGYEDSVQLLRFVLAEMERRRGDVALQARRWVVIVDEVAQLAQVKPEAGAIITQLSQLAGGLRINLVVASQAANPSVFGEKGSLALANFPSRLVFQLPADQAYLATLLAGQHTERLAGKGDGLAISGDRVTRFRAALPQRSDYATLPLAASEPEWPETYQLAGDAAIKERWQIDPEMVLYGLIITNSATALQKHFGGKMDRARVARDYVNALKEKLPGIIELKKQMAGAKPV